MQRIVLILDIPSDVLPEFLVIQDPAVQPLVAMLRAMIDEGLAECGDTKQSIVPPPRPGE